MQVAFREIATMPRKSGGGMAGYDLWIAGDYTFRGTSRITINDSITLSSQGQYYSQWYLNDTIAIVSEMPGSGMSTKSSTSGVGAHFSQATKLRVELHNPDYPYNANCSVNGTPYFADANGNLDLTFSITEPTYFTFQNGACLSPDTIISTKTGEKVLSSLREGDKVLSLDADGELSEDEVTFTDSILAPKYGKQMDVWRFSDGTMLKTIQPHEFFSADEQRFKYIADFKMGERIVKADGATAALESHEVVEGAHQHMTLFTKKFNTYFANGVLTGNRHSVKFNSRIA